MAEVNTAETANRLPSPDERPEADVLVFDGHCRMCSRQVEKLCRWDTAGRLAFLSLHDPLVAERYADLSHEHLMREMVVVDGRGRRHGGAAAVRYLTRRLPRLWWLAPLLHIPGSLPLWQAIYRQVARRRYLLGGTTACEDQACELHRRG